MEAKSNLLIADTFLSSIWKLDRSSQKKVQQSLKRFSENVKGNGFQVHSLDRIHCDQTFKSARVDRDIRLIFSQQRDKYILLYVDHHDAAYDWAVGKYLSTSQFGSLYIHNQLESTSVSQENNSESYSENYYENKNSLLAQREVKVKDLIILGLTEEQSKKIHGIIDEDEFIDTISELLPELQEGLIDLFTGTKSLAQVYSELEDQSIVGDDDFTKALSHKDSKRRFYLLEDIEELEEIINGKFEYWKLFLHPKQEYLVKRMFNGPALVEGGPGTGKTVVGIHRAIYLAKHVFTNDEKVLICTYSRKLAHYMQSKVEHLCKQKNVPNYRIEVRGIDSLIYQLAMQYKVHDYEVNPNKVKELMKIVYDELKPHRPLAFYKREYEEVIQRLGAYSKEKYLNVSRKGQGMALNQHEREKIWSFFNRFNELKKEYKVIDFEDQAHIVCRELESGKIPAKYASIIIDEAQDLSPIRLKLLSKLCYTERNNLFILSDLNQRIFKLYGWKSETDIHVVGRTHYLSINYRTTKQIREYADKQFIKTRLDQQHLREYKSLLSGPDPIIKEFDKKNKQYQFIVRSISVLTNKGVKPSDICIISPGTTNELERIANVLEYEEIPCTVLEKDIYPDENTGVGIISLQGCKGLEFRYVFLPNFDEEVITEVDEINDEWYELLEAKRSECLKYVAITRAREEVIISIVDEEE